MVASAATAFSRARIGLLSLSTLAVAGSTAWSEVKLPNVFSDHMMLQRDQPNKLWGKAEPGESVSAEIAGQTVNTQADANGDWSVMLPKLQVGGPLTLTVNAKNQVSIKDILVGEVWICSGQSNMAWKVSAGNDPDLEKLAANYPQIRMINFKQTGSQKPVWSHEGQSWMVCSPETVLDFSAVGYYFGRQLHQTLNLPIGLINNAWGGSACEAWIDRSVLKKEGKYDDLLQKWNDIEAQYAEAEDKEKGVDSKVPTDAKAKAADLKRKQAIVGLKKSIEGNQNPGNIYNGVLVSHLGYGIRGAIWYQGESNASRAYQYRDLFPLMISTWRSEWKQGDFPFYWVQLADYRDEVAAPAESDWAELREAQTLTMKKLPKTGQAVIVDIGEGKDIHPKNKVDVGRRLARWALANDYGIDIAYHSPEFKAMTVDGGQAKLVFDYAEGGWRPFDVKEPQGFAVAGSDKVFHWATAVVEKDNSVTLTSPEVKEPVAVRYAWANNPVCNMFSVAGLPLTPFRTDDWPGVTAESRK
jgi:sialate O-acetylesterase